MTTLEEIFGIFDGFEYRIRKPLNKAVEKFGINDTPFMVQPTISGKQIKHPAYSVWRNMLRRCYNIKYKEKNKAYSSVTCCKNWLLFTNFAKWFKNNYIEGYQLDKDLLVKDNLIYSPYTCIFVPQYINGFLILKDIKREIPIGVSKSGSKYIARVNEGFGKINYIGTFDNVSLAHKEWQKAKLEQAIALDFPPLQRVIDQLRFEIENNLETISL